VVLGDIVRAGYRMRMPTLELWQKWPKIRLHLARPELDLDGTNNASERSFGRSRVRYKTMGLQEYGGDEQRHRISPMAL
jgi:hypothetical protein